jgi:hypothetical protein
MSTAALPPTPGPTGPSAGRTLVVEDRRCGVVGPPPVDGAAEIRWATSDGVPVVVKAAAGAGRDRLRREGEVLSRLGGAPGPDLVELVEGADHTELVTRRFGNLTVAEAPLLTAAERSSAILGACRAVQALHDQGWAHGSLEASHLLVGPAGEVRLCALSQALPISSEDASADVAALADVLDDALDQSLGFESGPTRRRWARVARRCRAEVRRAGPSATAQDLHAALHAAGLGWFAPVATSGPSAPSERSRDTGAEGSARGRRRWAGRRLAGWGLAVAVAAALGATTAAVLGPGDGDAPPREVAAALGHDPDAAAAADVADPPEDGGVTCPPVSAPPGAAMLDIDGDGCPEPVEVSGRVVHVGARSFEVGVDGDRVAVADWDCDGIATVLALRPRTGEVFAFPRWATERAPADAIVMARAPGAETIEAPTEPCGPPRLLGADGRTTIPPRRR